jgi:hypothetical protein
VGNPYVRQGDEWRFGSVYVDIQPKQSGTTEELRMDAGEQLVGIHL